MPAIRSSHVPTLTEHLGPLGWLPNWRGAGAADQPGASSAGAWYSRTRFRGLKGWDHGALHSRFIDLVSARDHPVDLGSALTSAEFAVELLEDLDQVSCPCSGNAAPGMPEPSRTDSSTSSVNPTDRSCDIDGWIEALGAAVGDLSKLAPDNGQGQAGADEGEPERGNYAPLAREHAAEDLTNHDPAVHADLLRRPRFSRNGGAADRARAANVEQISTTSPAAPTACHHYAGVGGADSRRPVGDTGDPLGKSRPAGYCGAHGGSE